MSTTNTQDAPAVDANHPDREPGAAGTEQAEAPAKAAKRTRYQELGIQNLTQPDGKGPYLKDTGRFATGHDAKLKRDLIAMVLVPDGPKVGGVEDAAEAKRLLSKLGWGSHLDKAKATFDAKTTRKAASDKAKADKAAAKAQEKQAGVDRIEQGKANKAAANEFVDKAVRIKLDGDRKAQLGQVLRVHRSDESDILSPWVAVVQVREDPKNPDSPATEHEVPISELKLAS